MTTNRDGAVLRITLDRPSRRNSLNQLMIETLVDAADRVRRRRLVPRDSHPGRRGRLLRRSRLGGHQQPRRTTSPHRRSGAPDSPCRPPRDRARATASSCRSYAACGDGPWAWAAILRWPPTSPSPHRRRVLGAIRRPGFQPGFGFYLATPPASRPGTGPPNATSRRESERARTRPTGD